MLSLISVSAPELPIIFVLYANVFDRTSKGSSSSIRLLARWQFFQSISNHAARIESVSLAVPSNVWMAAARWPARSTSGQPVLFAQGNGRMVFSTGCYRLQMAGSGIADQGWPTFQGIIQGFRGASTIAVLIRVWMSHSCKALSAGWLCSCALLASVDAQRFALLLIWYSWPMRVKASSAMGLHCLVQIEELPACVAPSSPLNAGSWRTA